MVFSREKYARRRVDVEAELFKEEPVTESPPDAEEKTTEQTEQKSSTQQRAKATRAEQKARPQ
jgi:hypothetical protein